MSLTKEDLATLAKPFDEKTIGIKIQSLSQRKDKALLVAYVQHTDAYDRIEMVDPAWSNEVSRIERADKSVNVFMRMTIKGVTRENAGEGEDEKSATSDALKRVAMLFGIGRYLYDQGTAWVPYSENDKFRKWTYAEFNAAIRNPQDKLPASPPPAAQGATQKPPTTQAGPKAHPPAASPKAGPAAKQGGTPAGESKPVVDPPPVTGSAPRTSSSNPPGASLTRPKAEQKIFGVYPIWIKYVEKETPFMGMLARRYNVDTVPKMTFDQVLDLIDYLESELRPVMETQLLEFAKAGDKDAAWLDQRFVQNLKKPLAECTVEELNRGLSAMVKARQTKR